MGKFIFWAVLIVGGLLVGRVLAQHKAAVQRRTPPRVRKPEQPATRETEAMVRCAHCGIHLPRSEAVLSQGKTWCSTEHARLGPATRPHD
ncbi:MAG: PP0621 family protein [Castellaniella sp.]